MTYVTQAELVEIAPELRAMGIVGATFGSGSVRRLSVCSVWEAGYIKYPGGIQS